MCVRERAIARVRDSNKKKDQESGNRHQGREREKQRDIVRERETPGRQEARSEKENASKGRS